jgi:arginyl-tRNA synthetase
MVKGKIANALKEAVREAQEKELLPRVTLPEIVVERPQSATHGDYACSSPLKLARIMGLNPLEIAERVARLIAPLPEVEKVEVARPGFINFTLRRDWLAREVEVIRLADRDFGSVDLGRGRKVQLEFVSVNPTGPLHVGHGRGAILGDTLANVLAASGYSVQKEYYVNDAGGQIDAFYRSMYARYQQAFGQPAEIPEDGYRGDYVVELAGQIIAEEGDSILGMPRREAVTEIGRIGLRKVMESIRADLELIGVSFDVWFSEKSLYEAGQYEKTMSLLRTRGHVAEREGAVWFTSAELGDDKDNVLVRSNGVPTYFASDVAYHYNKLVERQFDRVINIWGADHQGHVPRMKAVLRALDIDPARLQIIITQMVTLRRGGVELRISKRSGDMITLREVVEEVGGDACRYFFLSRSADSQMVFDLELATKESEENPVFYVQYAHARIASILRLAAERNIDFSRGDVSLLATDPELNLIRRMIELPEVVEIVAANLEPHHLPHYALELATAFHGFYRDCRVITEDEALTAARLKLVDAARTVLVRTLSLMGMTAPDRM